MKHVSFRAMGCQISALIDADGPRAARLLAQVPVWFDQWERRLSRFRPDSELMRLNQRQGRVVRVSRTLWEVLRQAQRAQRLTAGLVTPALLDALVAAGYDRSFDEHQTAEAQPPASGPEQPRRVTQPFRLLARPQAVLLAEGVRLDVGGVAKGWAAQEAARRLARFGPTLVDAGGDIAISGPREGGAPWPVAVADPLRPEADLALLLLGRGGVATSGREHRRWQHGGAWQHHIIDPRSRQPATTDVLSATIVAPSAPLAEAAAKATLIQGSRAGLAWLEARPSMAGLLVLTDGRVLRSRGLAAHEWHERSNTNV
ncbi:MAG: FAD:protein FMN transferase [Roseiflexaceae bacterium]